MDLREKKIYNNNNDSCEIEEKYHEGTVYAVDTTQIPCIELIFPNVEQR